MISKLITPEFWKMIEVEVENKEISLSMPEETMVFDRVYFSFEAWEELKKKIDAMIKVS